MTDLPLDLARFRLDYTVTAPLHLHYYAGSQLRGAFGHALKFTVCVVRHQECRECPLYRGCAYPEIFETPAPEEHHLQKFSQAPNPYVIEPPPLGARDYRAGETLSFGLVILGRALRHLPYLVYAWQRALGERPGVGGGAARLTGVSYLPPGGPAQPIYDGQTLTRPDYRPPAVPDLGTAARLRFDTPLRLQQGGAVRGHGMTARDLLMALARRYWLLAEFHQAVLPTVDFRRLAEQAAAIELEGELRWRDWRRYSSRQQQTMILGGVIGAVTLRGDLAPFAGLLAAGQWTHLGKNATFGLGRYRLEPAPLTARQDPPQNSSRAEPAMSVNPPAKHLNPEAFSEGCL